MASFKKNVLITGGGGFIGANFAHKFLDLGYDVYVIERKKSDLWRLGDIKNKIRIHFVDLKNYNKLESFIFKLKPQTILHFAASIAYPKEREGEKEIIENNFLGTVNLVNACSKINFKCFINTGSGSEYGIKDESMKETDFLEPNTLYGITKAASTLYCQYMAKKLDLPLVTLRPFFVYGYFENKEKIIPTVIKSCLEKSELKLSSPNSVRDFIFIEDIIEAYLLAIENIQKIKGEIFNLGTGIQTTIDEVVNLVKEITPSTVKPQYGKVESTHYEPKNWVPDISKIKRLLNWQPRFSLRDGLEKDTDWFRKNISLYK